MNEAKVEQVEIAYSHGRKGGPALGTET